MEIDFQISYWWQYRRHKPALCGGIIMELMIGNFATSKTGHDKGRCYVVVGEEGEFVYLCDGRIKKLEKPKRKRKKHIQIINRTVDTELVEKLSKEKDSSPAEKTKASNEENKYAIKQYLKQV